MKKKENDTNFKKKPFGRKKLIWLFSVVAFCLTGFVVFNACSKTLTEVTIPTDANLSVTTLPKPETGTPADVDNAINNLYIAQGVATSNAFKAVGDGLTKASIVSQGISSERIVNNGKCYKRSISASKFVKVGKEYYIAGDNYLVRDASKVSSVSEYQFSNEDNYIKKLSATDFYNGYGNVPNTISGYILNDDTIKGGRFVGENNGIYQFKYELEPTLSTIASRNEMKTMAGTEKHPVINKVTFTLFIDSEWKVVKTNSISEYQVEMKGLGVVDLEENLTEVFTFGEFEIPNNAYFESKCSMSVSDDPTPSTPSDTDILLDALAPYLDGSRPLVLEYSTNISDKLNGEILLNLDINDFMGTNQNGTINTNAIITLGDKLKVLYKNNYIYVNYEDFNAKIGIDEAKEPVMSLINNLGIKLDLTSINTDGLLDNLVIESTEDGVSVNVFFEIKDIRIAAKLFINSATKDITAKATINDYEINLNSCTKEIEFNEESETNTFLSLLPVINKVNEYISGSPINFTLSNQNISDLLNGKISVKLNSADFAQSVISASIADFAIQYKNNELLVNKDNFFGKLNLTDAKDALTTLLSSFGVSLDSVNIDINQILNSLVITGTNNGLSVNLPLNVDGKQIEILASVNLETFEITVSINLGESKVITLNSSSTECVFTEPKNGNYTSLLPVINKVNEYISGAPINFTLTTQNIWDAIICDISVKLNINEIAKSEILARLGNINIYFVNNNLKLNVDEFYGELDLNDENNKATINRLLAKLNVTMPDVNSFDIESIISSTSIIGKNNAITLSLTLNSNGKDITISADINLVNFNISAKIDINDNGTIRTINLNSSSTTLGYDTAHEHNTMALSKLNNFIDAENLELKLDGEVSCPQEFDSSERVTKELAINYSISLIMSTDFANLKFYGNIILNTRTNLYTYSGSNVSKSEKNARTHTIAVNFENDRLYFDYNGIKGTFNTNEFAKSKETIQRLFNYIPELGDVIDQLMDSNGINTNFNTYDLGSIVKAASNYDAENFVALSLNLGTMSNLLSELVNIKIKVDNGIVLIKTNPTINLFGYNFNANLELSVPTNVDSFAPSSDSGYIVFDTINNLLEVTANTAEMRHFHITGSAETVLLKEIKIQIDCYLDIDENKQLSMKCILSHDDSSVAFENKNCKTTLYIKPGDENVYYEKNYTTKGVLGIGSKNKTEYGKFTNAGFNSNPVKAIVYLLDINETIANMLEGKINGNDGTEIYLEKIFKNYAYNESKKEYSIDLSLSSINSSLGDANLKIYHTADNKLDKLTATLSVASILTLTVNGSVADYNNADYGTLSAATSFIESHTFSNLY